MEVDIKQITPNIDYFQGFFSANIFFGFNLGTYISFCFSQLSKQFINRPYYLNPLCPKFIQISMNFEQSKFDFLGSTVHCTIGVDIFFIAHIYVVLILIKLKSVAR